MSDLADSRLHNLSTASVLQAGTQVKLETQAGAVHWSTEYTMLKLSACKYTQNVPSLQPHLNPLNTAHPHFSTHGCSTAEQAPFPSSLRHPKPHAILNVAMSKRCWTKCEKPLKICQFRTQVELMLLKLFEKPRNKYRGAALVGLKRSL